MKRSLRLAFFAALVLAVMAFSAYGALAAPGLRLNGLPGGLAAWLRATTAKVAAPAAEAAADVSQLEAEHAATVLQHVDDEAEAGDVDKQAAEQAAEDAHDKAHDSGRSDHLPGCDDGEGGYEGDDG